MATRILMNVSDGDEYRIAVTKDGLLHEYFLDRPSQLKHVGDIYRGVVSNTEPAIQAVFVDIGYKKNAFLHVSDVIAPYNPRVELSDIYGTDPVEVIPVEEIDFSEPPEHEIEIEDDLEVEPSRGPAERSEQETSMLETVSIEKESEPRAAMPGDDEPQHPMGEPSIANETTEENGHPGIMGPTEDGPGPRDGQPRHGSGHRRRRGRRGGVRHRQRRDAGAQSDRVPRIQQAPFEAQPDEANDPPPPRIDDDRDFNAKGDNDNTNQQRRPRRRGGRGRGRGGRGRRGGSGGQGNGGGPQSWSPRDGNQSPRSEPGNFSQGSWNDGAREPNGFRDAPGTDDGDGPVRYFRRENFPRVQNLFRRGQEVLVQVLKAAQGGKGPGVTTYISLPGRYMVLMPNTTKCGVSRKIFDHQLRNELRRALRRLKIPRGMGVIIRTAAAGRPIEELQRDLNYLLKTWNEVLSDLNSGVRAPSCSYRDSDPAMRTVRDYFTHDVSEIVIDNESVYKRVLAFFDELMPDYRDRVKLYSGKVPLFMAEGVEPQVDRIFDKRVSLPSGGYLYVEQTEALVAIDVNSGRFTSERDAEETAFKTNLEAIPEIARQLRLRDLGGIIVNDFIDMQNPRHRREIEDKLRNELQKERTRVKVSHVSPFGLIEMTRQRVRPSLRNFAFETCKHCQGAGMIKSPETQALHVLRVIKLIFANDAALGAVVQAPPAVLSHLHSQLRPAIADIETSYNKHVSFEWAGDLGSEELRFFFINYRGDRTTFDHHAEIGRYSIVRTASPVNGGEHGHRRRRRGGRGRRRGGGSDRFAPVQQGASDSNRMTSVAPQEVPQTVAVAAEPAAAPETRKTTRGARTKRASRKVTAAALEVSQASGEEAAPAKKTRRKTTRKAASGERPVTRRRTARKKPEPPAGDAPQS